MLCGERSTVEPRHVQQPLAQQRHRQVAARDRRVQVGGRIGSLLQVAALGSLAGKARRQTLGLLIYLYRGTVMRQLAAPVTLPI